MIDFIFAGARADHAPDFISEENVDKAVRFYEGLEDYAPTPLLSLDALAKELGLGAVLVKDESKRFGLNAFKAIGGMYAVYRVICDAAGRELTLDEAKSRAEDMLFVTATDGNHGRSVAYCADRLGARSVIFMPKGSAASRVRNIEKIPSAKVFVTEVSYDGTVAAAREYARDTGAYLVQDTSFEGYERIPAYINTGYCVMAREALLQSGGFTHTFLQAGVGSMAAAVAGYFARTMPTPPRSVIVEPHAANCIFESVRRGDGRPHSLEEDKPTIMAGLNCQTPSLISWEILRDIPAGYASISDETAKTGMRILKRYGITSGESGAATMGLLHAVMTAPRLEGVRIKLGLDDNARVLLFSTEGDTDPENYKKITIGY